MQARSAKSLWAFVFGLACPRALSLLGLLDGTIYWAATEHLLAGALVVLLLRPYVSMFALGVTVTWIIPSIATPGVDLGMVAYWALIGSCWGACAVAGELIAVLTIARLQARGFMQRGTRETGHS